MGLLMSKLSTLFDSFGSDPARILMVGLDAAGKTTIMYKLKLNEAVTTIPTIGFNVETITPKKGLTFTVWDVGGQDRIRALWKHYFQNTQGLIYVVDSCDRSRFEEAHYELTKVLEAEEMAGVPVIILANKQDLPNAASCSEIAEALKLSKLTFRKWHVQATCATNGEGLYESMDILAAYTKEFKKRQSSHF
ncbi:uncharacterized protein [Watersipora subatra]|uniref:uncharacterized protein n=1 Tax=Watersipora subatra TaxID=2589382 RepID=UPI00355C6071